MAREQLPHRVIFVCGSARSGSTLVDLVLGNDPRGFSLGEVASWYRPTRTHHFDIKCGCGVYPCPVWRRLKDVPEQRLYATVFEQHDVDFVVDSSKRLPWIVDQTRRLRRDRRFEVDNLFLYKQPLALAYSHFKRGEDPVANVRRAYSYYEEAARAHLPMTTVDLDWLLDDPAVALPVLGAWLELDLRAERMEFWRTTHHHLFGSFGPRRQLHGGDRAVVREPWSEEFTRVSAELERALDADPAIGAVTRRLRENDVRNAPSRAVVRSRAGDVQRPRFYWEQKLRDLRARFFPRHHLDREASLVREWNV